MAAVMLRDTIRDNVLYVHELYVAGHMYILNAQVRSSFFSEITVFPG